MRDEVILGDDGMFGFPVDSALLGALEDLRLAFLVPLRAHVAERHLASMYLVGHPTAPLRHRGRAALLGLGLGGALMVGTTGLAAAGVLPDPVQQTISSLVRPLGINVPDGSSHPSAPSTSVGSDEKQGGGTPDGGTPPSTSAPPTAGASDEAPGRGGENPGNTDQAPGLADDPGHTEDAPGLGGPNPGKSSSAPGQDGSAGDAAPSAIPAPPRSPAVTPPAPTVTQPTPTSHGPKSDGGGGGKTSSER